MIISDFTGIELDVLRQKCNFVCNEKMVFELRSQGLLHEEIAKIITAYREENGDPPADMLAVYNYLHEEQISKARKVKTMQSMYGG